MAKKVKAAVKREAPAEKLPAGDVAPPVVDAALAEPAPAPKAAEILSVTYIVNGSDKGGRIRMTLGDREREVTFSSRQTLADNRLSDPLVFAIATAWLDAPDASGTRSGTVTISL